MKIQESRVQERGGRFYSTVTGKYYATRAAAVRAERNAK